MIYRILLAMKNMDRMKAIAARLRQRAIPCEITAFRSVYLMMRTRSLDHVDVVVTDAASLGSGMLFESLVRGPLSRRLLIYGSVQDERAARLTVQSGVRVYADEGDIEALCDGIEDVLSDIDACTAQDIISRLLDSASIPMTLKGGRYLAAALRIVRRSPEMMDNIHRDLYKAVAQEMGGSPESVERSIRYALSQSWSQMNSRQKSRWAAHSAHWPTNKFFLEQMLNQMRRDDDCERR